MTKNIVAILIVCLSVFLIHYPWSQKVSLTFGVYVLYFVGVLKYYNAVFKFLDWNFNPKNYDTREESAFYEWRGF